MSVDVSVLCTGGGLAISSVASIPRRARGCAESSEGIIWFMVAFAFFARASRRKLAGGWPAEGSVRPILWMFGTMWKILKRMTVWPWLWRSWPFNEPLCCRDSGVLGWAEHPDNLYYGVWSITFADENIPFASLVSSYNIINLDRFLAVMADKPERKRQFEVHCDSDILGRARLRETSVNGAGGSRTNIFVFVSVRYIYSLNAV